MVKTTSIILRCVNQIPGSNLDIIHYHTPGIPQAFDKLHRVPLGGNLTSVVDEQVTDPKTTPFVENVAD